MTINKPSSWLLVLYDVPSQPSRLKVRVWREFKSIGALYPPLSICLIPDNTSNRERLIKIEELIAKNGKVMKLQGKGTSEDDQNNILRIFRIERDKQYDEILEECQEFIDEIKANIRNKKTAQEEVEEMHEVLDGLKRWLERVKSIDWIERPAAAIRVERLLEKCQDSMDKFAEISHPKKNKDIR
ncbi:MAG TPA: Chromate resistance protein ChrB [Nitrososphaeraceae archaeon]|jgi:hypothetical protein